MNIALYLRLSQADGDLDKNNKDESNSIENQRILLTSFVETREDLNPLITGGSVTEYVDDGYTGTNFDRPAFKQMVEDVKAKKINTIIVKDLSRLGRDYIGVGDYLEQIFPLLGVRVIAVNSNYDSDRYKGSTLALEFTVNNLINSLYSKDLSKKLKSSLKTKWEQGQATVGRVPYGYKKNEKNPRDWDLDTEAAEVVRLIYDKALDNWNTTMIANYLNEKHFPPPGAYKEKHLENYEQWNRKVSEDEWLWEPPTVLRILKRKAYTGVVIQGQRTRITVGSNCSRKSTDDEVYVIKDHHPAIVSEEEWKKAQRVIHSPSKQTMPVPTGFSLNKKMRCGCCGLAMVYDGHGTPTIQCMHGAGVGKSSKCDKTRHSAAHIEAVVLASLKKEIALFSSVYGELEFKKKADEGSLKKQLSEMDRKLKELKTRKITIYEEYAEGKMTKDEYLSLKAQVTNIMSETEQDHERLSSIVFDNAAMMTEMNQYNKDICNAGDITKLTPEIVDLFIKQVTIYDKEHIEVCFTFEDTLEKVISLLNQKEEQAEAS